MVSKIVWTRKAVVSFENTLEYLHAQVSEQAAMKFANTVMTKVENLGANRFDGQPVANTKSIRFILIGKYHRLYYRRDGLSLFITQLYDTRQNPDKRPYSKK